MKNTVKFAGLFFALALAATSATAFAKPITRTTARTHASTIHDRGTHAHTHESVAHH